MKRSRMLARLKALLAYEVAPALATDLVVEEILKEVEKVMKPVTEHPSGCLHSMREMCNCQTTYSFKWDKE